MDLTEVEVVVEEEEEEECSICGLDLKVKYCHTLICNHTFHYECLMKTFITCNDSKSRMCPYCRNVCSHLPVVNGLKKINPTIHVPVPYKNTPCNKIIKRGARMGEECGKNCKLGYYVCGNHFKI